MKQVIKMGLLVLLVSVGVFAFFGCQQGVGTEVSGTSQGRSVENNEHGNSRNDLALMKALGNHKVTRDELEQIVLDTFNRITGTIENNAKIEQVINYPINNKNKFQATDKPGNNDDNGFVSLDYETEPVELFEFAINNNKDKKYVLASNDIRIGHFLALTDGSFGGTEGASSHSIKLFNSYLNDYIDFTMHEYNDITEEEVNAAFRETFGDAQPQISRAVTGQYDNNPNGWVHFTTGLDLQINKPSFLATKWGQGSTGAYSYSGYAYNNYIKYRFNNNNRITGCGPIAIAQLLVHWGYISPYATANKPPAFTTSQLGTWNGTYNLWAIRDMEKITNTSTAAARGQVAALLYHIHKEVGSEPLNNGEVVTKYEKLIAGLKTFGYSTNDYWYPASSVSGPSDNPKIDTLSLVPYIKNALNLNKPVLTYGQTTIVPASAHYWLVDGHGTVSYIREYFHKNGRQAVKEISLNNALMVHCNMGWNGNDEGYFYTSSGWYVYGIFDAMYRTIGHSADWGYKNFSTRTAVVIPRR